MLREITWSGPAPAPHHAAHQAQEYPLELVSEDAVDDEVDGAVDGDQQVVGLGQGVVLVPEMLTMAILNQVLHNKLIINNTHDFYSNFIYMRCP